MPIVSVVIPTRNRCALLERAIQSVLKQSLTNLEIIVVDDSSSDQTQEIIEKLKDKRLKYFRLEKQSGGAVARNKGISFALGEYIAFLDDDDEWLPEKLQKQVDSLESNPLVGICYTGRRTIRKGLLIFGLSKKFSFKTAPDNNHFRSIMKDNFIGITSSVMIRRLILIEEKGFDEQLPCFQDYDLYIRILKHWKAKGIDEPLVNYYLEGNTKHVSLTKKNVSLATKYLLQKYKDEPYIDLLNKALRIINLKKMIKSVYYAREVLKFNLDSFNN
ncbi:MAG: glycosyltransferase family 2 protein [Ignavibacteriales bacterium]|nr:glycosyltransferase family 2 protein [Ignavibacteriales bacterium]